MTCKCYFGFKTRRCEPPKVEHHLHLATLARFGLQLLMALPDFESNDIKCASSNKLCDEDSREGFGQCACVSVAGGKRRPRTNRRNGGCGDENTGAVVQPSTIGTSTHGATGAQEAKPFTLLPVTGVGHWRKDTKNGKLSPGTSLSLSHPLEFSSFFRPRGQSGGEPTKASLLCFVFRIAAFLPSV